MHTVAPAVYSYTIRCLEPSNSTRSPLPEAHWYGTSVAPQQCKKRTGTPTRPQQCRRHCQCEWHTGTVRKTKQCKKHCHSANDTLSKWDRSRRPQQCKECTVTVRMSHCQTEAPESTVQETHCHSANDTLSNLQDRNSARNTLLQCE